MAQPAAIWEGRHTAPAERARKREGGWGQAKGVGAGLGLPRRRGEQAGSLGDGSSSPLPRLLRPRPGPAAPQREEPCDRLAPPPRREVPARRPRPAAGHLTSPGSQCLPALEHPLPSDRDRSPVPTRRLFRPPRPPPWGRAETPSAPLPSSPQGREVPRRLGKGAAGRALGRGTAGSLPSRISRPRGHLWAAAGAAVAIASLPLRGTGARERGWFLREPAAQTFISTS